MTDTTGVAMTPESGSVSREALIEQAVIRAGERLMLDSGRYAEGLSAKEVAALRYGATALLAALSEAATSEERVAAGVDALLGVPPLDPVGDEVRAVLSAVPPVVVEREAPREITDEMERLRKLEQAAKDAMPFIAEERTHRFLGECPEPPDHLDHRDPECEACRALDALRAALEAPDA